MINPIFNIIFNVLMIIALLALTCFIIKSYRQLKKDEENLEKTKLQADIWRRKTDEAELFFNNLKSETERMEKELEKKQATEALEIEDEHLRREQSDKRIDEEWGEPNEQK